MKNLFIDQSGKITATAVVQVALAANKSRSGYLIQNRGDSAMYVNDLGTAGVAVDSDNGSFMIQPGAFFPPIGYPISVGEISIIGTIGNGFTVREW